MRQLLTAALGGSIQNIVTEDDATAKSMIAYLKQNRFGRATFLPIQSIVDRSGVSNDESGNRALLVPHPNWLDMIRNSSRLSDICLDES